MFSSMKVFSAISRQYASKTIPNEMQTKAFKAMTGEMLPPGTLKGRTAMITGGGTGIGKGISIALAKTGANVFITSRKKEVLDKGVEEIAQASGNKNVFSFPSDVRDVASINASLDACKSHFGQTPDLIVNNAAGNFISPTLKLSPNAFSSIIDIVLKGTINVTMQTAKRLIEEQRPGAYLSISTLYATTGSSFVVPSAVAKAGVETLTKSLAVEWSRYGLRFNAIAPGPIYTKGAFSRLDPTGRFQKVMLKRLPTGRLGDTAEIANLACYMLSDYASWMTGEVVTFDGGELAHMCGEFNVLNEMVSDAEWDMFEKMIRDVNKS